MADDLTAVEDWAAAFLQRLAPSERRVLAGQIARELRRSQAARITAQENPDGSAFKARKPQPRKLRDKIGSIKRGPMFKKLRLAQRLKIIEASGQEIAIGFTGRNAHIARIHQEGLAEQATSSKGKAFSISYHQRRLLGLTDADSERLMDTVLAFLDR
jgi:phage virion morphogenesis protein